MAIIQNNDSVYVKYEIPKDIDSKIPNYFYRAMEGELISVMGRDLFAVQPFKDIDEDSGEEYEWYDLDSGTNGWDAAIFMACKKLDMMWLYEYQKSLEWYDYDKFCGILEDRIWEKVYEKTEENQNANDYYQYVCKLKDEAGKEKE